VPWRVRARRTIRTHRLEQIDRRGCVAEAVELNGHIESRLHRGQCGFVDFPGRR
jgi:hypothetical protein